MIFLDTNVISELNRPAPDRSVVEWLDRQNPASLATTAVNEAEILVGLALLPHGRRRDGLYRETMTIFEGIDYRVFPFDRDAAEIYPLIVLQRRSMRLATEVADGQIAAIARCRSAAVATRNTTDFAHCGIDIVNPWTARP